MSVKVSSSHSGTPGGFEDASDVSASNGNNNYVWDSNALAWTKETQPLTGSVTVSENVAQFGGNNVVTGTGVSGLGIPRVTVSSDSFPATQPVSGTVTANQGTANTAANAWPAKVTDGTTVAGVIVGTTALKIDTSSIAGTATVTAAAGVQKVGIVGNANAIIDGAIAAVPPANALQIGIKAATANPANATAGNQVAIMGDKAGRQVVTVGNVRELVGVQTTLINISTAETTIITAGAAGVFNDLSALIVTTNNAAAGLVTIKDATAGTTRMVLNYPNATVAPSDAFMINFVPPISQAVAANNWTATCSVNAASYNITAVFVKNT